MNKDEKRLVDELHTSVYIGDLGNVKRLIEEEGVEVDCMSCVSTRCLHWYPVEMIAPLHAACRLFHEEIARYLISKGASLEKKSQNGNMTPLLYALRYGSIPPTAASAPPLIRFLILEAGGDVCATGTATLFELIHKIDTCYDLVLELLKHPKIKVDTRDRNGRTILHMACRFRDINGTEAYAKRQRIISVILERSPELLETKDNFGHTPLLSSQVGNITSYFSACRLLITRHGANVNATNNKGETLLQFNCNYARFHELRVLVEELGANPLAGIESGNSPLDRLLEVADSNYLAYGSELINWEKKVCFLASQHDLLPPSTAQQLWTYLTRAPLFLRIYEVRRQQFIERLHAVAWNIRMHWIVQHCRNVYEMSPEETQQYPVHSILRCLPYLRRNDGVSVVNWSEVILFVGRKKFLSRNPSGMVPWRLYMSLQMQKFQQERSFASEAASSPRHAVVFDWDVLQVLLDTDRRLLPDAHNHLVGQKRKRQPMTASDSTTSFINPLTTPILVVDAAEHLARAHVVARVHLDLLYRLIRAQPEVLRSD